VSILLKINNFFFERRPSQDSGADGERCFFIYSLIGAAKLNGLNPQTYLRYVIERIVEHPINRVHELTWHLADILRGCNESQIAA
jgi:transposase